MIAEPYINLQTGEVYWHREGDRHQGIYFQQYADFEREKLKELDADLSLTEGVEVSGELHAGYSCYVSPKGSHYSSVMIDYSYEDHRKDSESSRLLKRAEFLKAVCEREGVEWLPEKPEQPSVERKEYKLGVDCACPCHEPKGEKSNLSDAKQQDTSSWFGEPSPKPKLDCHDCWSEPCGDDCLCECHGEKKIPHEFEVNSCGGSACKNCGQHETRPMWPPYCSPQPPKEERAWRRTILNLICEFPRTTGSECKRNSWFKKIDAARENFL